ncbi:MAG: sulfur carrier protein ThiS [Nanoarchaeota archaeon]
MQIKVNGKALEINRNNNINELIGKLGIKPDGLAIALNSEVVGKDNFNKIFLKEGDKVEIIHAVQGG